MTATHAATGWTEAMPADSNLTRGFEAEFDRCGSALYRFFVVRAGGDSHLADDMMQQLWVQANPRGAELPSGEIEFYLRGIATNLIRQHWRRIGTRPNHVPIADAKLAAELAGRMTSDVMPIEELARRENRDQLMLAITQLPAEEQSLIIEHYFHGRPQATLASTRGLSERAVEGRLYRARQSLKAALEHLEF